MIRVSGAAPRSPTPFLQSNFEIVYDRGDNPSLNGSYGPTLLSGRAASAELLAKAICVVVDRSGIVQNPDQPIDKRYHTAAVALSDSIDPKGKIDTHVMRQARSALMAAEGGQGILQRAQFALTSLSPQAVRPLTLTLPPVLAGLRKVLKSDLIGTPDWTAQHLSLSYAAQSLSLASACRPCQWFSPDTGITLRSGIEIRTSGKGYRLVLPWSHALLRVSHKGSVAILKQALAQDANEIAVLDTLKLFKDAASRTSSCENESAAIERERDYVVLDYALEVYSAAERLEHLYADPVLCLAAATAAAFNAGRELSEGSGI